jgi:hypothetical protein
MDEPPARTARTVHDHPEQLSFSEAAARLGISRNAVRMRASRGTLATALVDDVPYVLWPQPARAHARHAARTHDARASVPETARHDDRLVAALEGQVARLEADVAFLHQQIERQTHLLAGLIQRLPNVAEIAAGEIITMEPEPAEEPTAEASADAPVTRKEGLGREEGPEVGYETLRPSAGESVLRRWWRRMTGGAVDLS